MYLSQNIVSGYRWGGGLHNAQYFLFEIMKEGIEGEIGRIGACAL